MGQSDSRISFASSECCEAIIPSGKGSVCNVCGSVCLKSRQQLLIIQGQFYLPGQLLADEKLEFSSHNHLPTNGCSVRVCLYSLLHAHSKLALASKG